MVVLALILTAAPTVDSALASASQLVGDLKFKQAQTLLSPLRDRRDLERGQVVQWLDLSARVAASQGRADEATALFGELLEIAPDFALQGRASPKITTPFFEARAAVFKRGALTLTVDFTEVKGRVTGALLSFTGREGRVATFEAEIDEDGASRKLELRPGLLPVDGQAVRVRVRGRDAKGWVLLETQAERTAAPVLVPVAAPTRTSEPPIVVTAPAVIERSHGWRTAGLISLGGSLAAVVAGIIFQAFGAGQRAELERAIQGRMGDVVPLTYPQASRLNADIVLGRDGATAAWISAGALAAFGATGWLIDAVAAP